MRVQVVPYDPTWPAAFEAVRADLAAALRDVPLLSIEHVGSTSVPGLAAKPILDIDVVVRAEQMAPAIAALEAIGYVHKGDLGVPERESMDPPDASPKRNVYVVREGSLALRNHRGVRDVLRADAALRDAYGSCKLALAQVDYEGIDGYMADKTEILQTILRRAGLSDAELSEIEGINRPESA